MITFESSNVFYKSISGNCLLYPEQVFEFEERGDNALFEKERFADSVKSSLDYYSSLYIGRDIFESYEAILKDEEFLKKTNNLIDKGFSAAKAVYDTLEGFINKFEDSDFEPVREKASDLRDVRNKLLSHLAKLKVNNFKIDSPIILLCNDLSPAELISLDTSKILGVISLKGSKKSHTAILLGLLDIPYVCDPNADFDACLSSLVTIKGNKVKECSLDCKSTLNDKKTIPVYANIFTPSEAENSVQKGADGIGLYRTEFEFIRYGRCLTEAEQKKAILDICKYFRGLPVIVRSLDIGFDKKLSFMDNGNLRGIEFSLQNPEMFLTQLKAIGDASKKEKVSLLLPYVKFPDQVLKVKEMIKPYTSLKLGIMVETKESLENLEDLVKTADFLSVGTNDLQRTLNVDREEIVNIVKNIVDVAHAAGKKVCVCGDMAGDISYTNNLVLAGVDSLSVAPSKVPVIKSFIKNH